MLAQEKALTIEDCFSLAAEASRRFFGRSPEESVRVGKALIQGSVDRASPIRPVAERGIAGFSTWRTNREKFDAADFAQLLTELRERKDGLSSVMALPQRNLVVHEDTRLLRDFYPDPSPRHRMHYLFVHRFLPKYIHENPLNFFRCDGTDPTRFVQARWAMMEKLLDPKVVHGAPAGTMLFRRVSDIQACREEIGGHPAIIITMPTPEQPSAAFFVGAILLAPAGQPSTWSANSRARVFTLERILSLEGEAAIRSGRLCEWTASGEHRDSGLEVEVAPPAFRTALASVLQLGDQVPATAGHTPATQFLGETIRKNLD